MIVSNNISHGYKIAEAAGTIFNPAVDRVISRVEKGELYGGVIYTGYTLAAICLHQAGFRPNWANRDMLWVAFHYPFVKLGCKKIIGQVPASKTDILAFDQKLGFKEEARIRDVFPDGDLVVLSMTRDQCRWLSIKPRGVNA